MAARRSAGFKLSRARSGSQNRRRTPGRGERKLALSFSQIADRFEQLVPRPAGVIAEVEILKYAELRVEAVSRQLEEEWTA
jgi:hypothetical protein